MGLLLCPRCNAKTKASSIQEGRERLDHSIGLYIGKPCQDGKVELIFTEDKVKPKPVRSEIKPAKSEIKSEPKKNKSKF